MHFMVLCATCEIQRPWKVSQSSGVEMYILPNPNPLLPVKGLLTIHSCQSTTIDCWLLLYYPRDCFPFPLDEDCLALCVGCTFSMTSLTSDSAWYIHCIILTFTVHLFCYRNSKICYFVIHCSYSTPPLLLSPHAVQQKQQLEKETGLKIVEAGVSDVSKTH